MADPTPTPLKPAANSIAAVVDEVKNFLTEDLTAKKEDLAKIVAELETKLSSVLKAAKGAEAKVSTNASAILHNSEDSPLYNAVQEVKSAAHVAHDGFESVRNKLSGLIDRLHI